MIYVDNGATSFPKPPKVIETLIECVNEYAANPGRSGHKLALKMDRKIYEVRNLLTEFIGGTNPMQLVFTSSGTDSLNIAIHGVIEEGIHVITTSMEHNSVLRPLMGLKEKGIIEVTIVQADEKGCINKEQILDAFQDNTKLVAMTHMSNLVGSIMPIKEIGQAIKDKAIFLVDAAQSIGTCDIDVEDMNIDLLCFPGHKGLFGPMGTGALYVREGLYLNPLKQGGTGSFSQEPIQPDLMPDHLESGTPNGPGIIALGEGIKFIEEIGRENINKREEALFNKLIDSIKDIPNIHIYGPMDERQGPVLAFNLGDRDSAEISHKLDDEYDIGTRPGLHCAPLAHKTIGTEKTGAVRVSLSYFNTEKEIEMVAEAIHAIAKEIK